MRCDALLKVAASGDVLDVLDADVPSSLGPSETNIVTFLKSRRDMSLADE